MTSTHEVPVMILDKIEPHPNADRLGIFRPFGCFTVVVALDSWKEGDLVAYIQPESVVDTARPEFAFLAKEGRPSKQLVTVKKLRQVYSQGCLVPAPDGSKVGDDVAEILGVTHYEPEESGTVGGCPVKVPSELAYLTKYDIDTFRKYWKTFVHGEIVNVSEKLHGTSSRFAFINDQIYVGGRTQWLEEDPNNLYWSAFNKTSSIKEFIVHNPGLALYGEVYGKVQKNFLYDAEAGQIKFRAFDIRRPDGTFLDVEHFHKLCNDFGVPVVPQIGNIEFNKELLEEIAEQESLLGNCPCREGIVIRPMIERTNIWTGRTIAKLVSNKYLEKNK